MHDKVTSVAGIITAGGDAADIQPGEHVVVVGAFVPFLKALKRSGQDYTVLEIDPATLKPDDLPHLRPAEDTDRDPAGNHQAPATSSRTVL